MDWDAFYKDILPIAGQMKLVGSSSTVDAANPLDASRLGLGMGNGTSKNFTDSGGVANIFIGGDKPVTEASPGHGALPSPAQAGLGLPFGMDFGSALARVAIIILGFIFVAAGLSMFRDGG